MNRFLARLLLFASLNLFFLTPSTHAGDYDNNPELHALIEELVNQHAYTESELKELFQSVEQKKSILEAIARPAEKEKTWGEYRAIFLGDNKRIKAGVDFFKDHRETLLKAEEEFGVPAEIITAIIGVETYYGRWKGKYRVIDALATLAFDYPPRARFFRKQLLEFLILAREAHIDPATATGSYAGAMGYGQFIPSSYRHYAVDYDQDGITDIITDPVDAIGSVANYFKEHRWMPGQPVASRAHIHGQRYDEVISKSLKPTLTLAEIKAYGVTPVLCNEEPPIRYCLAKAPDDIKATVMRLQGEKGAEFWIGLHNFYVITRYNHSALYAMAVFQLSREIQDQLAREGLR